MSNATAYRVYENRKIYSYERGGYITPEELSDDFASNPKLIDTFAAVKRNRNNVATGKDKYTDKTGEVLLNILKYRHRKVLAGHEEKRIIKEIIISGGIAEHIKKKQKRRRLT